jgi:hypothetical protein
MRGIIGWKILKFKEEMKTNCRMPEYCTIVSCKWEKNPVEWYSVLIANIGE